MKKKTKAKKSGSAASQIRSTNGVEEETTTEAQDGGGGEEVLEGEEASRKRPKLSDEEFQSAAKRIFEKKDKLDAQIAAAKQTLSDLDDEMGTLAKEALDTLGGIQLEWKGEICTANHRLQRMPDGTMKDRYHFRGRYGSVRVIG